MAQQFPNGTVFGISTAYGMAVPMTAVSNASPAEATITTGAVDEDAVVIINSGWTALNGRIAVAGEETTGKVPLIGLDTSEVTDYPAGEGAGTIIPVTTFVDLSQQGDPTKSGGEQQYYNGQYLEDRTRSQFQIPTVRNAKSIAIPLDYDDKLPWYAALKAADRKADPVVLRCRLPSGVTLYYYVYPSFDADPSMQMNNPMKNTATFSFASPEFTRIEAA